MLSQHNEYRPILRLLTPSGCMGASQKWKQYVVIAVKLLRRTMEVCQWWTAPFAHDCFITIIIPTYVVIRLQSCHVMVRSTHALATAAGLHWKKIVKGSHEKSFRGRAVRHWLGLQCLMLRRTRPLRKNTETNYYNRMHLFIALEPWRNLLAVQQTIWALHRSHYFYRIFLVFLQASFIVRQ